MPSCMTTMQEFPQSAEGRRTDVVELKTALGTLVDMAAAAGGSSTSRGTGGALCQRHEASDALCITLRQRLGQQR